MIYKNYIIIFAFIWNWGVQLQIDVVILSVGSWFIKFGFTQTQNSSTILGQKFIGSIDFEIKTKKYKQNFCRIFAILQNFRKVENHKLNPENPEKNPSDASFSFLSKKRRGP